MNLDTESLIRELNQELISAYETDNRLFAELLRVQGELGLLYGDRPTCPFLRPHFISRALYDSIVEAAECLAQAAEAVTAAALKDDSLLELLDLTPLEKRLAKVEPGYSVTSVTSRFDTFVDGTDFKFLEYNAETPAGVGDQMQLEKVLERVPLTKQFLSDHPHWLPRPRRFLLRALFQTYREFGGSKSKPNISIVDWEGVSTEAEFEVLKDYFESMGFPSIILDPSELDYDGKTLAAGSFEIDILYKRVLINELLEKFGENHPLIKAYVDGNLCMANSFRVKIPHKKALFSIFSDGEFANLFTPEQLNAIRKHIPWTRRVAECKTDHKGSRIDLIEFARNNREEFLIKPNDDYGGKGITLGWESSEQEWDNALNEALSAPFVMQERVPIQMHEFPVFDESAHVESLLVDFDPFLFRNKIEGGMVRVSSDSLVNVTQGGGQTALVVLE
ncbi:MAG: hypothetical protein OEQ28_13670 [Acidobacteriota bacterium]|nr:hypothetical protein [Acidobacteriota bacterium]